MVKIRPRIEEDNNQLLLMLKEFNPVILDKTWKDLLWNDFGKGFCSGMVLENEGRIEGMLLYIINSPNDSELVYCNISSWIVNPKFRSHSVKLLTSALEIENVVILNLSPHENTRNLFKVLGFDFLSNYEYRVNPFKLKYNRLFSSSKAKIIGEKIAPNNLNARVCSKEFKQVFKDHHDYKNVNFYRFEVHKNGNVRSLILGFNQKKMQLKGFSELVKTAPYILLNRTFIAELIYCDDPELLREFFSDLILFFVNNFSIRSVNVSEHFFNKINMDLSFASKEKKDCPWFFYSKEKIEYKDINLLYSEKILLNL